MPHPLFCHFNIYTNSNFKFGFGFEIIEYLKKFVSLDAKRWGVGVAIFYSFF